MSLLRIVREKSAPAATAPRVKAMAFESCMRLDTPGVKGFTEIKDAAGAVADYRDVTIKGYLSTYETDRQGDTVLPGAYAQTIPRFMQNPVLLVDHCNQTSNLAGSFTVMREDGKGLYVEAALSNAPSDMMRDIRAKVAEGHLRTMSIGGIFHYEEDGNRIFRVDLWEGSLVPIPANPGAMITTRSVTDEDHRRLTERPKGRAETRP